MTVYVDDLIRYTGRGRLSGLWCHMATDSEDLTELHAMAERIGLKREWFQNHATTPHYDLRPEKRSAAVSAGAIPVGGKVLVMYCSKLFRVKRS